MRVTKNGININTAELILTVPLSTQEYKWVTGELSGKPDEMLGVPLGGLPYKIDGGAHRSF